MTQTDQNFGIPDKTQIHSWGMLRDLLKEHVRVSDENFTLANGQVTDVYVDVPAALCTGTRANTAALTTLRWLEMNGIPPNTITAFGGPRSGADILSHSVACLAVMAGGFMYKWFSVRDQPKDHGVPGRVIEGAELGPSDRVVLVDDVINTGDSLKDTYLKVNATGAEVVAVVPFVDRSGRGATIFRDEFKLMYRPLFMYYDLELQPL